MNRFLLIILSLALMMAGNPAMAGSHGAMSGHHGMDESAMSQMNDCCDETNGHSGHNSKTSDCPGCDMSVSCCPSFTGTMLTNTYGLGSPDYIQSLFSDDYIQYKSQLAFLIEHPPRVRS